MLVLGMSLRLSFLYPSSEFFREKISHGSTHYSSFLPFRKFYNILCLPFLNITLSMEIAESLGNNVYYNENKRRINLRVVQVMLKTNVI